MSSRVMSSKALKVILTTFMLVILFSGMVFAQEDQAAANAIAIDTMWTLIAAFLVFFMQAGFAMVEAGFTRAKNAGNIIMKNMMDFASGSLVFWAVGFAFMFGAGNGFIGSTGYFLQDTFANLGLLQHSLFSRQFLQQLQQQLFLVLWLKGLTFLAT